jgi:hypothetical protein
LFVTPQFVCHSAVLFVIPQRSGGICCRLCFCFCSAVAFLFSCHPSPKAEESVVVFAFAGVVVFAGALAFFVVIPEGNLLLDPTPPRTDGVPHPSRFCEGWWESKPSPSQDAFLQPSLAEPMSKQGPPTKKRHHFDRT